MLNRRGFSLIEILMAMAIIALLAGVLVPQLFRRSEDAQATALLQTITSLATSLAAFDMDVGRYPSRLTMLSTQPAASSLDICGRTMPLFRDWKGPYIDRILTSAGLRAGTAVVADAVVRDPVSAGITTEPGTVVLTATEVDQSVATAMQAELDGDENLSAGAVRWSVGATAGRGTLTYRFPIRGC